MTHVTCRLTAKNQDQVQNPTLGNRVWASFLLTTVHHLYTVIAMPHQMHVVNRCSLLLEMLRDLTVGHDNEPCKHG